MTKIIKHGTKKRLKSTSKDGQSLKARAKESKGKRKKELTKLSKVDHDNYMNAPDYIKAEIIEKYKLGKKKKTKTKNNGRYI